MAALVYYASGEQKEIAPKDGKYFSLEEMQGIVGGFIEILSLSEERKMVVNEEGLLEGLPVNPAATRLLEGTFYHSSTRIAGNALVMDAHHLETEE